MRIAYKEFTTAGVLLLLSIALMLAVGCGGRAQTSGPAAATSATEMKTFSKYGFSFEFPKDFLTWEDGLLDEEPNETSGLVQVAPEEEDFPLFAVSWVRTWQYGLEGGLEAGFEGISNWTGIEAVNKGETIETTKTGHRLLYQEGHRLLYQYYTATTETQGELVYGIVGAFYCPDTQRTFSLVTMQNSTTGSSSVQAFEEFESYLDSFVSH